MRGKKDGCAAGGLGSCGTAEQLRRKKTGSVLSAYDYGYQAGEADEIAFEKPGADIRGICGNVLFFCTGGVFPRDALFCRKPANG